MKQKIKNSIIILIFIIFFTILCFFYNVLHPAIINGLAKQFDLVSNKSNLLVHFIDVGQANAVAVNLPDGKTMIVDAGGEATNVTFRNYVRDNVLNSKHKNYIDYVVLSHADEDHIGGLLKLLQDYKVGVIYLPQIEGESNVYNRLITYVENNCNYKILTGEHEIIGKNYKIFFFNQLSSENANEASQILKLSAFGKSFLFTGDISSTTENLYINAYQSDLNCDVLSVAHHGSRTSTSQQFLDIATPDFAVISVGRNNIYNHPHEETVERLTNNNIKIVRTDESGDVLFVAGEHYDFSLLSGNYSITGLSLNYVWIIIVTDVILVVCVVHIFLKKEKKK